jgi:hypothetical protein
MQAEQIATSQLDSGERLLWAGSPAPGSAALGALPVTLFGIPFTGFAAFWIWGAYTATRGTAKAAGPWMLFPLFGVPFLLVGLAMLLAPVGAYLGALSTVYAVTDRRAFIVSGRRTRGVRSFAPEDIGEITRFERADGHGSVFFGSRAFTSSRGLQRRTREGFVGIPEVRHVEQLIRDHLQQRAAA